jgi:hypothetical protein
MLLRRLNSKFTHGSLKGRKQLLKSTSVAASVAGNNDVGRPYFTFMDRVKEAVKVPVRHVESFFEPQGYDYESQLPNTENLHGNTAMVFNAYLTHNAIDMNTWHDMDNTYHNQFGTVDNPVLIFTTDSSWRIVICQGPGVEDDSHAHEKMFYFVREGPMNRCHLCGQCFKLVRLKDEFSEINDYYSYMFSSLSHFDVSEEDCNIPTHQLFGDRPAPNLQTAAAKNVYIHVNPDEADHMLVDPAYKLEKLTEAYDKLETLVRVNARVVKDSHFRVKTPTLTSRTIYDNWFLMEKSIRKLDRYFLKVEKFNARQYIDSENHDRREKRMLERKRDRWTDNYTYFFGGLTEEEQMYRDYFQTDLEEEPEDEVVDTFQDELNIASTGEFNFSNYEFIETGLVQDSHESLMDLIDRKIFKFRYRMNNDSTENYLRRMDRVVKRQLERAKTRDPEVETNISELLERSDREDALGVSIYNLTHGEFHNDIMAEHTHAIRKYMYDEAVQQYKDYYESDPEEQGFFEYVDELPARDRIKFVEIFDDFTIPKTDGKGYIKIPKREYNPELSYISNVALDLVDFKDRVSPLTKDAGIVDAAHKYQRTSAKEAFQKIKDNRARYNDFLEDIGENRIQFSPNDDLLSSEELLSSDEFNQTHQAQSVEKDEEVPTPYEREDPYEDVATQETPGEESAQSSEEQATSSDEEHSKRNN